MQHIAATKEELEKINAVLNAPYPATLKNVAQALGVTELAAAQKMPAEIVGFVQGNIAEKFAEFWGALCEWEKVTLFIVHDSHVFEVQSKLTAGKEGHGYYNVLDHNATIGGHLNPAVLKAAAFIEMPFMGRESLSVQFFNHDEAVSFSIYVGRENHALIPSVKDAFFAAKAQFCGE